MPRRGQYRPGAGAAGTVAQPPRGYAIPRCCVYETRLLLQSQRAPPGTVGPTCPTAFPDPVAEDTLGAGVRADAALWLRRGSRCSRDGRIVGRLSRPEAIAPPHPVSAAMRRPLHAAG